MFDLGLLLSHVTWAYSYTVADCELLVNMLPGCWHCSDCGLLHWSRLDGWQSSSTAASLCAPPNKSRCMKWLKRMSEDVSYQFESSIETKPTKPTIRHRVEEVSWEQVCLLEQYDCTLKYSNASTRTEMTMYSYWFLALDPWTWWAKQTQDKLADIVTVLRQYRSIFISQYCKIQCTHYMHSN